MKPMKLALVAVLCLAGCGGSDNPFIERDEEGNGPEGTDGTENPTASRAIFRVEERSTSGNGYAEGFVYDAVNDTFTVDNLAFDGGNVYARSTVQPSLGPNSAYEVYEGAPFEADSVTGVPIRQFNYRAIQGRSTNVDPVTGAPASRFAIVRTGAYTSYGFGGFIYQRSGGFTLPPVGQANYTGDYAGLRDFNGRGGLQYVEGDVAISVDFADFNDSDGLIGDGVKGTIFDRIYRDMNGNDISSTVLAQLNAEIQLVNPGGPVLGELPVLIFDVGPGLISQNGEIAGTLESVYNNGIEDKVYESGKYYAIVADTPTIPAGELVGIVVVEGPLPTVTGTTFRETGGFIVYR